MTIPEQAVKAAARVVATCIQHGSTPEAIASSALTAAAPHMSGVKVKQLEWGIGGNLYSAGRYNIEDLGDNWSDDRYQLYEAGTRIATFPSLVKAKAAAQADYEKRFWAMADVTAVEPSSQSRNPLPSELIREYVEDYEWRTDSGDYTPNNTERAIIEDAIAGYAGYVDEVFASSAREQALEEAAQICDLSAESSEDRQSKEQNPFIRNALMGEAATATALAKRIRALKSKPTPQRGGGE